MGALQRGRAAIVGGSMSGLLAGVMLRRAGWQVDIFERSREELSGRGAGIVAQPDLLAALQAVGLDTAHLGVRVGRRRMLDPQVSSFSSDRFVERAAPDLSPEKKEALAEWLVKSRFDLLARMPSS